MELLSPAKNADTGIIAINSGADAVYIGASDFGARKAASNSVEDIERLCRHAHLYGAKVYVTLNTILYDSELPQAQRLIHQLHDAGTDALIIQDLGILKLDIPKIELHASTQMHNYDLNRIKFLDDLGFKRIVLARECSLKQIQEIRKTIKAEIECFGHGALCVSMSGQCYMSARLGGRSANRGECAQACRMKYSLLNAEGKVVVDDGYLLSLKDFSTERKIKQMIDSGVDSLKIEGRLKDSVYVANVTAYYRKLIDALTEGKARCSSGSCTYDYTPDLSKTFNRGFTEYFLNPTPGKMADFISPKSMGEEFGTCVSSKGNILTVNTKHQAHNGDGLCCEVGGEIVGFRIEKVVDRNRFLTNNTRQIKPGTIIRRNLNTEFVRAVEHSKTQRKISIELHFSATDSELKLEIIDEDHLSTTSTMPFAAAPAQNPQKAFENLKNSMSKTGSQFQVVDFQVSPSDAAVPFVPNSIANELRRKAIEMHIENRIRHFAPKMSPIPDNDVQYFAPDGDYHLNAANKLAVQFYKDHGCEVTQPAFELLKNTDGLEVMTTKYCIRRELGFCTKLNKKMPEEWLPGNFLLKGQYQDFSVIFDCKDCCMRIYAK